MNEITIVTNKIDDLVEVLEVSITIFQPNEERKKLYHSESDWMEKIKNGLLVTAYDGTKVIGFAVSYIKSDDLHIWNVGVLPEYRKRGVWEKMYEITIQVATEKKFTTVSLNTYKDKFPGMYNFCLTHGFAEYKTEFDEMSGSTKSMFLRKI